MPETINRVQVGDFKLTEHEFSAVMDVAGSDRLSPGPQVLAFEDAFALRHGSQFGVMTNSGTDALRIALATLKEVHGWKDGDVVLVPSVTFVATVNVVLQLNLVPRLVDVSETDFNMDPFKLRLCDWTGVKGIIVAHLCGKPARMPEIMALANERGIPVIEDSCETMGVEVGGKPVGSWGDIGCFSFYVAHLIVTGVGGMAVCRDSRYESVMRSFMNHGRDPFYIPGRNTPPLSKELLQKRFRFERIGYSCRPTEFEAAIGLSQLERLDQTIAERQRIAGRLTDMLFKPRRFHLPAPSRNHAFMMYPILVSEVDKWDLCLHLEQQGIETRELLPLTNQPCYKGLFDPKQFPTAEVINRQGFYIGCHQYMTDTDIARIVEAFNSFAWP